MALEFELKRTKKPQYPTKTTINLANCNQHSQNVVRSVALFAVAMVAVLLFSKFAVVDVMGAASASAAKADAAQAQLSALEASNADFNELQQRYDGYAANNLSDEEKSLVDRQSVLALLESTVLQTADLRAVQLSGNIVQLRLANPSLEDVSGVVASLEGNNLVSNVNVSTAKTDKNDDVISTIVITLGSSGSSDASASAKSEG